MKNFVIKSLEFILWIAFFFIVISAAIAMPVIGIIPGLIIGALVTGLGFLFIAINDNLKAIRELLADNLARQDAGQAGPPDRAAG